MKCVIANCNNSNEGKASATSFFRFPSDAVLRNKWISFCCGKKFNPNTAFICMLHFKAEDFKNNLQYEMGFAKKRLLKNGAVPTIDIESGASIEIKRMENKKIVESLLEKHGFNLTPPQENDTLQSGDELDIKMEIIDNTEYHSEQTINMQENKLEIINSIANKTEESIYSLEPQMEAVHNIANYPEESISALAPQRKIIYHTENYPGKQSEEIFVADFITLNKIKFLENENLALRKDKKRNESELKKLHAKMIKVDSIHKYEKAQMEKRLAKAKFELASLEKKLQVIFTEGQIKKLKNGIKRQLWSQDDISRSLTLYTTSPKMYKLLHEKQFPLPAVRTLQQWVQKTESTDKIIF